jgi:hypothetical protein
VSLWACLKVVVVDLQRTTRTFNYDGSTL